MYKILLSIIILSSNTVLAMDGMHNHDSHNHNKHQDMTYVDGSKTKITDEMFLSFSAGLSNTQIVMVDVQGMVCDFCARGIEKTFNDEQITHCEKCQNMPLKNVGEIIFQTTDVGMELLAQTEEGKSHAIECLYLGETFKFFLILFGLIYLLHLQLKKNLNQVAYLIYQQSQKINPYLGLLFEYKSILNQI